MSITIRAAVPEQDFDAVAQILSLAEHELVTKAQMLENQQHIADGEIIGQIVAEIGSNIVGYGTIFHTPWMKAGRFLIKVWTHPQQQKTGIGQQLYDAALDFAQAHGGQTFESNVFDNEPHSLRFAETRGFKIQRHLFESVIDLQTFDASRFDGVIETVKQSGIRLFSLAEVGKTKGNLHKLWTVNRTVYMDDPATTGTFPNFEEFYKMANESPWFNPNSQFLAADGDEYIGLSAIRHYSDTNSFYHMMTGVMPVYRGRKIALALKLMTINYAQQQNGKFIRTDNDSQNAPMLAINRKLGYVPQPGIYRLTKD
jgi:GNAT superfamily N-acetyltransferase